MSLDVDFVCFFVYLLKIFSLFLRMTLTDAYKKTGYVPQQHVTYRSNMWRAVATCDVDVEKKGRRKLRQYFGSCPGSTEEKYETPQPEVAVRTWNMQNIKYSVLYSQYANEY
jgi:hypothetical protein